MVSADTAVGGPLLWLGGGGEGGSPISNTTADERVRRALQGEGGTPGSVWSPYNAWWG